MRFQRRGGRKRIVAPDASELVPATKPQPDGALLKALARAWRWQTMLDEGRFASARELSEAERVSLSYVSRILRLTLLPPDIIERILDGCPAPQLAELMQAFPAEWEKQRERLQHCFGDGDGLHERSSGLQPQLEIYAFWVV
jgi:ParB-like chromosome segregation protein Spo0J